MWSWVCNVLENRAVVFAVSDAAAVTGVGSYTPARLELSYDKGGRVSIACPALRPLRRIGYFTLRHQSSSFVWFENAPRLVTAVSTAAGTATPAGDTELQTAVW